MTRERRAAIAGCLSFLVPGLGLLYLGWVRSAWINFLAVSGTLFAVVALTTDPVVFEHMHYLFLSFAALSAGYAHGIARFAGRANPGDKTHRPTSHQVPTA